MNSEKFVYSEVRTSTRPGWFCQSFTEVSSGVTLTKEWTNRNEAPVKISFSRDIYGRSKKYVNKQNILINKYVSENEISEDDLLLKFHSDFKLALIHDEELESGELKVREEEKDTLSLRREKVLNESKTWGGYWVSIKAPEWYEEFLLTA